MKREQVLQKAFKLVHGPRAKKYGPPLTNHQRIAAGFSVIFDQEVTPSQVVKALIWLLPHNTLEFVVSTVSIESPVLD